MKAAKINDSVRNEQERFQINVHAQQILQASKSVMAIIGELKSAALLSSDFGKLNRQVEEADARYNSQVVETERQLAQIEDEAAALLNQLEDAYYSASTHQR
eukprot:jgi/Mesvir1/17097/Mv07534-RA.1